MLRNIAYVLLSGTLVALLPLGTLAARSISDDILGTPTVRVDIVVPPSIAQEQEQGFFASLRSFLGVRTLVRIRPEPGTKLVVRASAYASSPYQTDSTPCITAAGTRVRPGTVATNFLPLGTILDINGKKFIVEDRMNPRFDGYYLDLWFPSTSEALEFGRQKLEITVIGYGVPGQEIVEEEKETTSAPAQKIGQFERIGTSLQTFLAAMSSFLSARGDVNRYDINCLQGS